MVCSSPELAAPGQPSCGQDERRGAQPDLLWLAELTGAHLGLPPISQEPGERCSIWENLVSLVDFQSPGFPLSARELRDYIAIPRAGTAPGTGPRAPPLAGDSDYRSDPHVRPPYSYATLICMALQASQKPKLTLAAICKWISDNFCYFRRAHPTWQSSVRHNLCINKRFLKVPREKGEPGRGAFWKLHPRYAEQDPGSAFPERRARPEPARAAPGRLEVGAELQQLLRDFEEFAGGQGGQEAAGQQPQPSPQQGELTELRGDTDWEALLSSVPERGDLPASPPGLERLLGEPGPEQQGWDETLLATAVLEAGWPGDSSPSREQGAGDLQASWPEGERMGWGSQNHCT